MSDLKTLVEACRQGAENESTIVKRVICYGEAKLRFYEAFSILKANNIDVLQAKHLKDAFDVATKDAVKGDTVLLSPACASFDEFSGFEERGVFFKDLVKNEKSQ